MRLSEKQSKRRDRTKRPVPSKCQLKGKNLQKWHFGQFFFVSQLVWSKKPLNQNFGHLGRREVPPPYVNRPFWGWSGVRGQNFYCLQIVWNFFCRNYMTWGICRYFYFCFWEIFARVMMSQSWHANKECTTARGDPESKILKKTPQATTLPPVFKVST